MLQDNNLLIKYSIFPLAGPGKTEKAKKRSVNAEERIGTLVDFVIDSYSTSFSCSIFKNNYRSKENFLATNLIPLDFDEGTTVNRVIEKLSALGFKYALVYSQSHTSEKHKFHVYLPTSEPIINSNVYEETFKYVHGLFPESDQSVGNPDRMFFSSKEDYGYVIHESGKPILPQIAIPDLPKINHLATSPIGALGPGYKYYLENINKAQGNEWNNCLNAAVKDMAKRGIAEDEIVDRLQEGYKQESFNAATLREIHRNYEKGRINYLKAEERRDRIGEKEAKIGFSDLYKGIAEELDATNMVLKKGHERVKILKSSGNGEVHEISSSVIQSEIGFHANEIFSKTIPAATCKSIADTWFMQTESVCDQPAHVKFAADRGIAQKKLDFNPLPLGNAPIWKEMMNRTTNSLALEAFIYSIFVPQSYRQQYLWIYGDGGNGKSTITDLLSKLLGASYVVSDTNSGHNSQFFTYSLDGKRLLVFPDTNSETFVQTGVFKQLTGEGLIRMEGKGRDAYSAPIDVKIIINSNNFPTLSSKKADIRRIIFCEMAPLPEGVNDPRILDKLWEERAAILGSCQTAYESLTNEDGPIKFDCVKIEDLANAADETFEMIFEELLKVDEESIIPGPELRRLVAPRCKSAGVKRYEYWTAWLTEKAKLAKYGSHWKDGKSVRGFKGIKVL